MTQPFTCFCGKKFRSQKQLSDHFQGVHRPKKITCEAIHDDTSDD